MWCHRRKRLTDLGIEAQPVEAHIDDYLAHLRPGGRFAAK